MGLIKINKVLKKYREKQIAHQNDWIKLQEDIREGLTSHLSACIKWNSDGNKMWEEMMKELEGQEVFPKKSKTP